MFCKCTTLKSPWFSLHRETFSEQPKFCDKHVEFNIDRKVPLRQYFGEEVINHNNNKEVCARYSYGVGSGSTTVGGDVATTKTKQCAK